MENRVGTHLSAEATIQLQEGIDLLLSRWSAFQMAVQNEWGGRDSRQRSLQLSLDVFSWLTKSKDPLYIDDLENILDEFMLSLNTEVGDGSIEEIAEKLLVMHEECSEDNFISIEKLREVGPPKGVVPHIPDSNVDDTDSDSSLGEDDSAEMKVDAPLNLSNGGKEAEMVIDEPMPTKMAETDGWTVVASKRNRGRT